VNCHCSIISEPIVGSVTQKIARFKPARKKLLNKHRLTMSRNICLLLFIAMSIIASVAAADTNKMVESILTRQTKCTKYEGSATTGCWLNESETRDSMCERCTKTTEKFTYKFQTLGFLSLGGTCYCCRCG
jgi:hypothetical protein